MGLLNNKITTRLAYFCGTAYIVFVCCFADKEVSATVPLITGTVTRILSSCTTKEIHPQLPNLSFAKTITQFTDYLTCSSNETVINPGTTGRMVWYSAILPSPPDCCRNSTCHSTDVSTTNITSNVWSYVGSNLVVVITGMISSGPYQGLPFTTEIIAPVSNQLGCTKEAGMEILTGTVTFEVTGGPSCVGVVIEEYCPGLHYL